MIEYTTPDFCFHIVNAEVDLTQASHVYLTLKQGSYMKTFTENQLSVNPKDVYLWLDQDEISKFKSDGAAVEVQLNWTYLDSSTVRTKRAATTIQNFKVGRNLLRKVIE